VPARLLRLDGQPGDDRRVGELAEERQEQTRTHRHHSEAIALRLGGMADDRRELPRISSPAIAGMYVSGQSASDT
jgi:hypothetical protein